MGAWVTAETLARDPNVLGGIMISAATSAPLACGHTKIELPPLRS